MRHLLPNTWLNRPKVFVSCAFDPKTVELRSRLQSFIETELGFLPFLSEDGRFSYHPSGQEHISDDTVEAVSAADVYVLLVGSRYGNRHYADPSRSITQLEYERAAADGIPAFCYVVRTVWDAFHDWKVNPTGDYSRRVDDVAVFAFVETLMSHGWRCRAFDTGNEIIEDLRSQFANFVGGLLAFHRKATWAWHEQFVRRREERAQILWVLTPDLFFDVVDPIYSAVVHANLSKGKSYYYLVKDADENRQRAKEIVGKVTQPGGARPNAMFTFVPKDAFVWPTEFAVFDPHSTDETAMIVNVMDARDRSDHFNIVLGYNKRKALVEIFSRLWNTYKKRNLPHLA